MVNRNDGFLAQALADFVCHQVDERIRRQGLDFLHEIRVIDTHAFFTGDFR